MSTIDRSPVVAPSDSDLSDRDQARLLSGEILLQTKPHSHWGGAITASMYLPLQRAQVWQQLTHYPSWTYYFPDMVHSEVLPSHDDSMKRMKRLRQIARKAFLFFSAQVEIYLRVFEVTQRGIGQQIQFSLEKGDFKDFFACLNLQDYGRGTILTYSVQATPSIPVPSSLIQEAMRLDLPANMRQMRQVLCDRASAA